MADKSSILRHISDKEIKRVARYSPSSSLKYTRFNPEESVYSTSGTRHRLTLTSAVEYDVFEEQWDGSIPHKHARRQLVHHLYDAQIGIGHELLSALYGGAEHQELVALVDKLLESMHE